MSQSHATRLNATTKSPAEDISKMSDWQNTIPEFSLYNKFAFTLTSVKLEVSKNKSGKIVKGYKPIGAWKAEETRVLKDGTQYAILTGKKSNISVIDIDAPDTEHNKELMDMMMECNLVAKTNHGYHYVYKYTPLLRTTTSKPLALDVRNDDAIIFCSPSRLEHDGEVLASYEWIKEPMDEDEPLSEIPEAVIDYLRKLDERFIDTPRTQVAVAPVAVTADVIEHVEKPSESVTRAQNLLIDVARELPDSIVSNYQDWLDIGIIFYNENLTCANWDSVSNRPNVGYEAGGCAKKWATFNTNGNKRLSGATLWHKLKKSNPAKFYELMENRKDFINLLSLLNSNDVAKYFYNLNPYKYIYNEHMGWYSLTANNTWQHSEKTVPSGIKGDISNTLQQLTLDTKRATLTKYAKLRSKCSPEEDKVIKAECDELIGLIHKAYKTLGGADFCSGVVSFLDTYYNDTELEEKMDMNAQLFAFTDGVFDLEKGCFRAINPKDMISTTTGYKKPNSNTTVRAEINKFLDGLFENDSTKEYLMKVLASNLLGYNKFEKFYVFTGTGGNGKGVIVDLLTKAFGNYFYSVNVSLFTKIQERLDQPVPALVEARHKRIMMSTEPETAEKLQVSMLKKISGGDPIEARGLYGKHIFKCKPMYKPFFQANDIPKLSKIDNGVQRRMEIIKFPFSFVPEPKAENERQGDPDVKNVKCHSEEWRDEFILMLIEVYNKHLKTAKFIPTPDAVKESTGEYVDDNNPIKEWFFNNYDLTNKVTDKIPVKEVKQRYMDDNNVEKCDDRWFKQMLTFNGVGHGRTGTGAVYTGLKVKNQIIM